jgi:hypothetical protein
MRTWHSKCSQPLVYSIFSCVRTRMNRNSLKKHSVEGLVTYDFTLHLGFVITLHVVGSALGWSWDTFIWAFTISWSRLLARVWSGPKATLVICTIGLPVTKDHFPHQIESPWPFHFKHSHWWKSWRRSKFASHYAQGTHGVSDCKMDVESTWILTWH